MRVLVIPTWYPSGEDKLMGIYHKEFTEALNKNGIEANMLYIDRQRLSKPFKYLTMKKRVVEEEVNYTVYKYRMLNLGPIGFEIQLKSYVKKLDKALKDYLKKNPKPDVIHAQVTVPAGYAAILAGKKHGIPVVVTEHGGNLERFYRDEPFKKYGLYVLENSCYSTVSGYMKEVVLKYTDECDIIPNQVNTAIFNNDKVRKLDGKFRLISCCALREGKRLDIAFQALKKLIDEGVDIEYEIIGDGFYEDIYKKSAVDNGVSEYVTFLGRKKKEEIPSYLENAHALLISSELESFAIPGVEALASGIPVITTRCLGPEEFVDEKCGTLCNVNDSDDMARAIKKVIENYSQYDTKHMKEVADRYSEKSVVESALAVYKKAIKIKNNCKDSSVTYDESIKLD